MQVKKYDLNNNEVGTIEISDEIFNAKVNNHLIWLAITVEEANRRVGSANTKTKGEVSGSGRKPWRQKGTGRARVGYRRNPIWVGGGVVFGPKPRSYNKKINKKMKRLAYISVLSLKFKKGNVKIIEDIKVDTPKTKFMINILNNLGLTKNVLLIYGDKEYIEDIKGRKVLSISENDRKIKKVSANIPFLKTLHWNILNVKDIFYRDNILITESALRFIEEKYSNYIKQKQKA